MWPFCLSIFVDSKSMQTLVGNRPTILSSTATVVARSWNKPLFYTLYVFATKSYCIIYIFSCWPIFCKQQSRLRLLSLSFPESITMNIWSEEIFATFLIQLSFAWTVAVRVLSLLFTTCWAPTFTRLPIQLCQRTGTIRCLLKRTFVR